MNEELIQALMQSYGMDPQMAQMFGKNAQAEMQLAPLQQEMLKVNTFSRPSGHAGNILEGVVDAVRRPKVTGRHNEALMEAMGSRYGMDQLQAQLEAMQRQREEEELSGLYQQVPGVSGPAEAQLRAQGRDVPSPPKDARTTLIKNAEAMGLKPGTPEFNEYMRQATVKGPGTVVNVGDEGPQFGKVEPGFVMKQDESGGWYQEPIKGSPADVERQEAQEAGEKSKITASAKWSSVLDEVDQALGKVNSLTSGFIGSGASKVPGTEAFTLARHLDTIKANLGFDRLTQMREESKTGGALGQVSEIELQLLNSALTSVDPGLPPEQLQRNLRKVQTHYQNFLDALDGKMPKGYDEQGNPVAGQGASESVDLERMAQEAIAAGADPEQVRQRLEQLRGR